jgi:hypothetical protein
MKSLIKHFSWYLNESNRIRKSDGWRWLIYRILKKLILPPSPYPEYKSDRPHYEYILKTAAQQASNLGYNEISVIEFGVAGGRGLLQLEKLKNDVEYNYDLEIEIFGFDTGVGLPNSQNVYDLPYFWRQGQYSMGEEFLQSRLDSANLILGLLSETVEEFISEYNPSPIAGIVIDLDYYSSTVDALKILDCEDNLILPRVPMYFDDVVSGHPPALMIQQHGEQKAIKEYNESDMCGTIGKLQFPIEQNRVPRPNRQYCYHRFNHFKYKQYIGEENRELPLTE